MLRPDLASVTDLLVEPRWGRRGHGSRLLAASVDLWRADGFSTRSPGRSRPTRRCARSSPRPAGSPTAPPAPSTSRICSSPSFACTPPSATMKHRPGRSRDAGASASSRGPRPMVRPGRLHDGPDRQQDARHERLAVERVVPDGQRLPGRPEQDLLVRDQTGRADRVDVHTLDGRCRGPRPAPPWWRPASARGPASARAAAIISAVRRAVPLGRPPCPGGASRRSRPSRRSGRPGRRTPS